MPIYKDDLGRIWDYDSPEEAQRDGLVPATEEDVVARKSQVNVETNDNDLLAIKQGAQRGFEGLTKAAGAVTSPVTGLIEDLTGLGNRPGLEAQEAGAEGVEGHAFPEAFTDEARAVREANPISAGLGTAIGTAPAAVTAGLAAPAGATLLGAGVGGVLAESAVGATAQEYDDAWLEERPMELKNVAAYTLMFATGDFLLRGGARALGMGARKLKSSFGGRNIVSEAESAASKVTGEPAFGSVGAARAKDLDEPFDAALNMSDRDAAVLARDADDHLHLISTHAADEMTRVNQGLSENLGNKLKYEDFAENAKTWEPKTLERQAAALDEIVQEGDVAARAINAFAEGDKSGLDFGNLGKQIAKDIDTFNSQLFDEVDAGRRNWLLDEAKKRLDSRVMSINASHSIDAVTRKGLLEHVQPLVERYRGMLEDAKVFPGNAELQKSLNKPWTDMLKHWPVVQRTLLEATGHVEYGVAGAGRVTKEATADRMMALFGKDPRSRAEFGRHLSETFDAMQRLVEAREARGIVAKDGLQEMTQDLRSLREAWNLAGTLGIAKNRAAHLQRDPRKWAKILGDIGERAPGVGQGIGIVRALSRASEPLYIEAGTPLYGVWDKALRRYSAHPSLQDPGILQNYSPWMQKQLAERQGRAQAGGSIFSQQAGGEVVDIGRARAMAERRQSQGGAVIIEASGELGPRGDKLLATLRQRFDKAESKVTRRAEIEAEYAKARDAADAADLESPDGIRLEKEANRLDRELARLEHDDGPISEAIEAIERNYESRIEKLRGPEADAARSKLEKIREIRKRNTEYVPIEGRDPVEMERGLDAARELLGVAGKEGGNVRSGLSLGGIATSPMGVTSAVGAAALAAPALLRDREPPAAMPPAELYRGAVKGISRGGRSSIEHGAAAILRQAKGRGSGPLKSFSGRKTLDGSVEDVRLSLDDLTSDPSRFIDALGVNSGELAKTHPGLYMQLVQKTGNIVAYLKTEMPQRTSATLLNPDGLPPSFDRSVEFAFKYIGAARPRQAMRDIASGEAAPEEVAAFVANWGDDLWPQLQAAIVGQITRRAEAGRPLPAEQIRRLDTLLGMNGQLDPSAAPAVTEALLAAQDASAQQGAGQPAGGGSKSPQLAGSYQTRLGGIIAEQ